MSFPHQEKPIVSIVLALWGKTAAHSNSKLQGHVEPRQIFIPLTFASGKIMDRILGRKNRSGNSFHARFRYCSGFQGASRKKPTARGSEDNCVEQWSELFVERAVYEDRGRWVDRQLSDTEMFSRPRRLTTH
jgi:hypothetical protein